MSALSHLQRHRLLPLLFAASAPFASATHAAESPVTWNLADIYIDDDAWAADRQRLVDRMHAADRFKGKLGSSAATLEEALDLLFSLQMQVARLSSYAQMRGDSDTRESGPQGMQQTMQSVAADLAAAVSWVDPEILAIPPEKVKGFLAERDSLGVYRRYLEQLEKRRPHTLDAKSEELLGMSARMQGVGNTVGTLLRNAEIPWPTIRLSDGKDLRIDAAGYTKTRTSKNRDDRIAAYKAFYEQLQAFKGTLAATLSGTVQEHVFNARARNYPAGLDASLAANEVDPAVYRMLVREIQTVLPTLHRYLKLRGDMLGIDDLRYHDMYPPLVAGVTTDYSWDNATKLTYEALAPLGSEYVEGLREALTSGWVDVYPRTGKRAGAYVDDAAYEVHPYMLLNHQDDYSSASTLAHEAGHLMHSRLSQKAQPYPTSRYVIFVAEVASTVNEVLFFKHLVAGAKSDEEKLALLGSFLEGLRNTVFRQTMFAEFELAIHEMVERGEPLTGDSLNALYLKLLRQYHGEAQGVVKIDDLYGAEWAFVPHFHYNFYVYQYATSYVAAIALAEGIRENRPGARERYIEFLKAGSTRPPVELLTKAGVDMTKPDAIRAAARLMNETMDQIEAIRAGSRKK